MVTVTAAILARDGKILIARRPAADRLANKWEFPGGKIEPGETAEAALIREINEELSCEIRVVRPLPRFIHAYDWATIELIPFVCYLAPGSPEPRALEHSAIAWVQPAEIHGYDLAAADLHVVDALRGESGETL